MRYEVSSQSKLVDIMTPFRYTFQEVVAQRTHYEKPTLRYLGCTPLGSTHVPHRSGDGSAAGRAFKPAAKGDQVLGRQRELVWPRLQWPQDSQWGDLR